ncbi:hypothetical protein ACOME3_009502 [Neoechinorhynchus agilis]
MHFPESQIVIYGVKLNGYEGRACMAAISGSVDIIKFARCAIDNLPWFAVPVFVRFCSQIEMTGTFKFCKYTLRQEGLSVLKQEFNHAYQIFYKPKSSDRYEPLNYYILQDIENKKINI